MTVITMSRTELTRLRLVIDIADGRLSVADAAALIGVGGRQIYRLLDRGRPLGSAKRPSEAHPPTAGTA
jgi:transposase